MDNVASSDINSEPQKKFAYSYERWSSQLQSLGSSEARQDKAVAQICQSLGLTLLDAIKDRGVSAKDGLNLEKEFSRLAQVVKKGEYVIVEDASRISRAGKYTGLGAIKALVENGIILVVGRRGKKPLVVDASNWEDDEVWNALSGELGMSKVVNDYQTIGKRAAWAEKKEALARGEKVRIYRPPCWLKNTPKDTLPVEYIIDPDKVKAIKRAFKLYSQGHGVIRTTQVLNQENMPVVFNNGKVNGRYGKKYCCQSVRNLLRDQRVIGLCDWVQPPVKVFPVVVDEDLFWKVQKIMDSRTDTFTGGSRVGTINLFAGLCQCVSCNSNFVMTTLTDHVGPDGNKVKRGYLYCSGAEAGVCKVNKRIRMSRMEEAFKQILGRMDILRDHIMKEEEVEPSRVPELEKKLKENALARQRLYDLLKRMDNPPKDLPLQLQNSQREEDAIVREIDKEKARLLGTRPVKEAMETYREKFSKHFDDLESRVQIRELIRSIVEKIEMDGNNRSFKVWFRNVSNPIEVNLKYHDFTINGVGFEYPKD